MELCNILVSPETATMHMLSEKRKIGTPRPSDSSIEPTNAMHGKYGYRHSKCYLWQDDGLWMNKNKVLRLMQEFSTTCDSESASAEFHSRKTKSEMGQGCHSIPGGRTLTVFLVKDLFNNEIVAYQLSERNENEMVMQSFAKAFTKE